MGNGCMSITAVKTAEVSVVKYKLLVIGDPGVGKSSIIERYTKNTFPQNYSPTKLLNIESVVRKLSVPDQRIVTVELWNIPTSDTLEVRKNYYLDTDAVIVVVDVCDDDMLELATQWKQEVIANIRHTKPSVGPMLTPEVNGTGVENIKPKAGSIPVLLLGNKFDV
uniref:Uncharacterized protein n=2 Tax=Ciona intestinalis TaxID=7719 RepID=F7B8S2_CIOIN